MARIFLNNLLFLMLWSNLLGFGSSAVLRTSLDITSTTELIPDFSETPNYTESVPEKSAFSEFLSLQNSTNFTEGVENASRVVINETISLNEETLALTSTLSVFNQFAIMETNASGDDSISGNIDQSSNMSVANVVHEEDFEELLDDLESAVVGAKSFDLGDDMFVFQPTYEEHNDSRNTTETICVESGDCIPTNKNLSFLIDNSIITETTEANIGNKDTAYVESISLLSTTIGERTADSTTTDSNGENITSFIPMKFEETHFTHNETFILEASTSFMSFDLSTFIESPLSTEIDVKDKCPQPGLCILWFLAEDMCSTDLHCIGTRICCKVRCSMTCIDAEHS